MSPDALDSLRQLKRNFQILCSEAEQFVRKWKPFFIRSNVTDVLDSLRQLGLLTKMRQMVRSF